MPKNGMESVNAMRTLFQFPSEKEMFRAVYSVFLCFETFTGVIFFTGIVLLFPKGCFVNKEWLSVFDQSAGDSRRTNKLDLTITR